MASTPIRWDEIAFQAISIQKLISEQWEGSESPLLTSLTEPQGLVLLSPNLSSDFENVCTNVTGEDKVDTQSKSIQCSPLKDFTNKVKSSLSGGVSCVTPVKKGITSLQCPSSAEFKEFYTGVMEVSPVIQGNENISLTTIKEGSSEVTSLQTSETSRNEEVGRIRKPTFNLDTSVFTSFSENNTDTVKNCDISVSDKLKYNIHDVANLTLEDLNVKESTSTNDMLTIDDSLKIKSGSNGLASKLKLATISIPSSCDLYSSFSSNDKSCDSDHSESDGFSDSELLIVIDEKPRSHRKPKLKAPQLNVTLEKIQPEVTAEEAIQPDAISTENIEPDKPGTENVPPVTAVVENEDCAKMKAEDLNIPAESRELNGGHEVSNHVRKRKGTFELDSLDTIRPVGNIPIVDNKSSVDETFSKPITNSGDNKPSSQDPPLNLLLKEESLPVLKKVINTEDRPRPSGLKPPGVKPALMRPGELQAKLGIKRITVVNKLPCVSPADKVMNGGDADLSKTVTKNGPTVSRLVPKQLQPPQKTKGPDQTSIRLPGQALGKIPLPKDTQKGSNRTSLAPMKALPLPGANKPAQSRMSLSFSKSKAVDNSKNDRGGVPCKLPSKKPVLKLPSKEPLNGLPKKKTAVSNGAPVNQQEADNGVPSNDVSKTVTKQRPLVCPGTVTKEKPPACPGTVTKEKTLDARTVVKEKPRVSGGTSAGQKHRFDDTFSFDPDIDAVEEFNTPRKDEKKFVPRRLSNVFSISLVKTGSQMNRKNGKQSALPTPNSSSRQSSVSSYGSTSESSFRKPSPFTNKKGNVEDLEPFKPKSSLVKNTPDVQPRRLSMWSPVRKQPIPADDMAHQCTKRLRPHQDGSR